MGDSRAEVASNQNEAFQELESYDWDGDVEFKNGLPSILSSAKSPEDHANLILQARCFYYSRKFGTPIDSERYLKWLSEKQNSAKQSTHKPKETEVSQVEPTPEASAPYPTSFAQIVELINSGKPISGIREIPDVVLEGKHSESITSIRKKPWERSTGDLNVENTSSG